MSTRKLVVLGTAAQVPTRDRNHSAYFLYWDHHGFLVDCGEGTQRQLTYFNVKASSITKILITHFHGDHCLGLPGILQRIALDKVTHPVEVYFPASGLAYFERLKDVSYFSNQLELIPQPVTNDGIVFEDQQLQVEAYRLDHPIDTFGYRIKEKDTVNLLPEKLDLYGLEGKEIGQLKAQGTINKGDRSISLSDVSIPRTGQCVAFVFDTRHCENVFRLASKADLLVCESTFSAEHTELADSYGHLTTVQAADIAKESLSDHLILTHFSQRYASVKPLHREAKAVHQHTSAARDGDVFELPRRKKM